MGITACLYNCYDRDRLAGVCDMGRIVLDLRSNRSDIIRVRPLSEFIYSPPDMPSGLRRGSALGSRVMDGRAHHAG